MYNNCAVEIVGVLNIQACVVMLFKILNKSPQKEKKRYYKYYGVKLS